MLKTIKLSDDKINFIIEELKKTFDAKKDFQEFSIQNLRKEHDKIRNRIHKLYLDKLDGKKTNSCAGSAVYNIPLMDFYKGLEGDFCLINEFSQYALTKEQRANFKEQVKVVYKKYNKPVDYTKLPKKFLKGLICEDLLITKLEKFIKSDASKQFNEKKLKEQYNLIKQNLIKNDTIKNKWKSEVEMFKTVSFYYPDAIFQYRTEWLRLQSLDVFIPS